MYSAVTKSEEKCCLNNPGVGSNFDSTKLASATRGALTLAALSALLLITPALARAQTETVLYSFCTQSGCTDGHRPHAGLVLDKSGNLYGTTYQGGANGEGTVFEVSPSGAETVLHSFCTQPGCTDGYHPLAGLVLDTSGNLYGTTYDGGAHGAGTVFEVSPSGAETVLYSFCTQPGCRDGYYPHADLVMDTNGNLYGTTQFDGAHGGARCLRSARAGPKPCFTAFAPNRAARMAPTLERAWSWTRRGTFTGRPTMAARTERARCLRSARAGPRPCSTAFAPNRAARTAPTL